jgi:hypothetical protein
MYLPTQNAFKYCSGLRIQNDSEFQMAFIMAHELTHSIDPCGISIGPEDYRFKYTPDASREKAENEYPIPGVIKCLRSEKSIHAGFFKPNQMMASGYGQVGPGGGYMPDPSMMPPTKPTSKLPLFCDKDQIGESFSDWMAAEVTPEYIQKNFPKLSVDQYRNGYSNIWRGICEDEVAKTLNPNFGYDPHPDQVDRTNRLILAQPTIRKQMNCTKPLPSVIHCSTSYTESPTVETKSVAPTPAVQPASQGISQ